MFDKPSAAAAHTLTHSHTHAHARPAAAGRQQEGHTDQKGGAASSGYQAVTPPHTLLFSIGLDQFPCISTRPPPPNPEVKGAISSVAKRPQASRFYKQECGAACDRQGGEGQQSSCSSEGHRVLDWGVTGPMASVQGQQAGTS